jgi:DNA-binding transcriptional regulator YiaG
LTCINFEKSLCGSIGAMPTPRIRTLLRASQILGGETQLASALSVSPEALAEWLSGRVWPHDPAYFAALDIVARSRFFARRTRKNTSSASSTKVTP